MDCKNTSINRRSQEALTLVELMIATGLSLVVGTAIALLAYYSARSFVVMTHYTEMGQFSRLALDKMSMEIREARRVKTFSANRNSITVENFDGNDLQFTYDSNARTLARMSGGTTNIYLLDCDALQFSVYQHTVKPASFDCYDALYLSDARVILVSWKCSRTILGKKATTDNVQSTKISLRNH